MTKKIVISTIMIMVTMLVAIFSFGVSQSILSMNKRPEAASEYLISNKTQMLAFIEEAKTKSFMGITVKLTADIDMGNHETLPIGAIGTDFEVEDYCTFEGTFDGQFHTVKNMTIRIDACDHSWGNLGFFGELAGNLKSLKLENVTIKNYNAPILSWRVGTLAGNLRPGGTIDSCWLKDCYFDAVDDSGVNSRVFGTLIGSYSFTDVSMSDKELVECVYSSYIKNVLIDSYDVSDNFDMFRGYRIGPGEIDCHNVSGDVGFASGIHVARIRMSNIIIKDWTDGFDIINPDVANRDLDATIEGYTFPAIMPTIITEKNTTEGLGYDVSSDGGSTGTTWYYNSKYNNGWPILRGFVPSWETHTFSVASSGFGTIRGINPVVVPSDLSYNFVSSFSYVDFGEGVDGQSLRVIAVANNYCQFDKWTRTKVTGGYRYIAKFEVEYRTVEFSNFPTPEGATYTGSYIGFYATCNGASVSTALLDSNKSYNQKTSFIVDIPYGTEIKAKDGVYTWTDVVNNDSKFEVRYSLPLVINHFYTDSSSYTWNITLPGTVNDHGDMLVIDKGSGAYEFIGTIIPYSACGNFDIFANLADNTSLEIKFINDDYWTPCQYDYNVVYGVSSWDEIVLSVRNDTYNREVIYSANGHDIAKYTYEAGYRCTGYGLGGSSSIVLKAHSQNYDYYIQGPTVIEVGGTLGDNVTVTMATVYLVSEDGESHTVSPKGVHVLVTEGNASFDVYNDYFTAHTGNFINVSLNYNDDSELESIVFSYEYSEWQEGIELLCDYRYEFTYEIPSGYEGEFVYDGLYTNGYLTVSEDNLSVYINGSGDIEPNIKLNKKTLTFKHAYSEKCIDGMPRQEGNVVGRSTIPYSSNSGYSTGSPNDGDNIVILVDEGDVLGIEVHDAAVYYTITHDGDLNYKLVYVPLKDNSGWGYNYKSTYILGLEGYEPFDGDSIEITEDMALYPYYYSDGIDVTIKSSSEQTSLTICGYGYDNYDGEISTRDEFLNGEECMETLTDLTTYTLPSGDPKYAGDYYFYNYESYKYYTNEDLDDHTSREILNTITVVKNHPTMPTEVMYSFSIRYEFWNESMEYRYTDARIDITYKITDEYKDSYYFLEGRDLITPTSAMTICPEVARVNILLVFNDTIGEEIAGPEIKDNEGNVISGHTLIIDVLATIVMTNEIDYELGKNDYIFMVVYKGEIIYTIRYTLNALYELEVPINVNGVNLTYSGYYSCSVGQDVMITPKVIYKSYNII